MTALDETAAPVEPRSPRNWTRVILVISIGLLLTLAGGLAGAKLAAPDPAPTDASAEAGFSRDMTIHHSQAVEMAVTIRDNTADAEIRTLALDITLTQQNQIGRMQDWLIQWKLPLTGSAPAMAWMDHDGQAHSSMPGHSTTPTTAADSLMPGMATAAEMQKLRSSRGKAAETLFLTLMIRHHRGGVDMGNAILSKTNRTEVKDLAQSIVNSQQSEINAMQKLLKDRGAPPA